MLKKLFPALLLIIAFTTGAAAQEVEVDRYTVNARIDMAASAIDARASVAISNLSPTPKPKLYFRLTKLAKLTAVTVNGAPAQFEASEDRRVATLNQVAVTPSASVPGSAKATVDFTYRIEAPDSSGVAAIYPGEVLMAPEAVWVPMPSTAFTLYGPTTAPFTLTVTAPPGVGGFRAASAGALKADAGNQSFTFEQPQNSLPFFVAGLFDQPVASDHGGVKFEIYVQPGLQAVGPDGRSSPEIVKASLARMTEEAGHIVGFLTKRLGPPPEGATFRVISSARTGNIYVPGALVLNQQVFRQGELDAITIERLADGMARLWLDGRVRLRGQEQRSAQADRPAQKARSAAFLRDSLPRYLAATYFEERFGTDAAREAFSRFRWDYTPIAKSGRDAELGLQTIVLPNYSLAVFGKGPLVLRLMAEAAGREKFNSAVRSAFGGPQTRVVTTEDFRAALTKEGGPGVDKIFQQWVDTIIEPDIIVGVPQPSGGQGAQRVNVRNLGTGDVTVPILAVTASGKQITTSVTVPSEDLTFTDIQTSEKINSVEVDPEKLIIQTDYDNDAKPARPWGLTLLNESIAAFNRGEYAQAEAKLREAARANPRNATVRSWLARTLAAQNKSDEAVSEANAAIQITPPGGGATAWAYITLGQIALARNKPADASRYLRRAVAEAEVSDAQFAAREALVKAERAENASAPVEESVRAFIGQLDTLIKQPSSDRLFSVVSRNNLKRFVQGLTVTPPTAWATEILRVDTIDSNRVAMDVALKIKREGRDQTATAVFVLYRSGSGWMLEDVRLFNVK
ncbi:MAG TPA: tetratricopeptide repeat protein [Blastocatellia bacterium]|nr:tetratricopeptide repeat protein [Blastocatellia bacterium]